MNRFENKSSETEWLPISDLMSVLMIVFMIISVFYMLQVKEDKDRIEEIARIYRDKQVELYEELNKEFKDDLKEWNAIIDSTKLSIRFSVPQDIQSGSPKIFFPAGDDKITKYGKSVLDDFFPRFKKILYSEQFKSDIEEIRIEGHTSSEWATPDLNDAYYENMKLSQDRTRNVLRYTLGAIKDEEEKKWFRKLLTANGLSSSKLILDSLRNENSIASRRVEFRVKTKAEESILEIVNSE